MIISSNVSSTHLQIIFETDSEWRNLATYLDLCSISLHGGWETRLPEFLRSHSRDEYWTCSSTDYKMFLDQKDFPILLEVLKAISNEDIL